MGVSGRRQDGKAIDGLEGTMAGLESPARARRPRGLDECEVVHPLPQVPRAKMMSAGGREGVGKGDVRQDRGS